MAFFSSASSSRKEEFEVFLSFRGTDTRKGFTAHLYQALHRSGIHTFMDDERLEFGDRIDDGLWNAIEGSTVCLPILSPNFAESRWCLMELAKMFHLNKKIVPVFYRVDPSDVRHQKAPFKQAFEAHELRFGELVVGEWRDAFKQVSEIKGYNLDGMVDGDEAKLIELIVKRVLREFNKAILDVEEYLIGIDSRVAELKKLLCLEVDDVRMIGIHGMGGIGKTTLAMVIYNQLFYSFDACSFISNVRDTEQHKLAVLQEKLIANILKLKDIIRVDDTSEGASKIKERFCRKRVLVVLDDVDHGDQLKALAGKKEWFGKGSRILVTTRDQHVINGHKRKFSEDAHKVSIYEPDFLNNVESLQLFSYHAFGRDYPTENFVELAKEVASVSGGLPLALEVFGCFLFDKNIDSWKDFLEKQKRIPLKDVQRRLRVSYDGLDDEERKIFLDIACFFCGMDKDDAVDIWKGSGLSSNLEIEVLLHKSLIKIDKDNKLEMHEQLRDMGRWIVRESNPYEPCAHSRLWLREEVLDVLENDKGTRNIEGISLDLEGVLSTKHTRCEAFTKLSNLRLLRANFANFCGHYKHMSKELRWLEWRGCPLKSLPDDFALEKVTVLNLSDSKIEQMWQRRWWWSRKKIHLLQVLDLSNCIHLKSTPDFSSLPMLRKLYLCGCENLIELHESIGNLKNLVILNMKECSKVEKLPDGLCGLSSLKELWLSRMPIRLLPYNIGLLENLHQLSLDSCVRLKELPDSLGNMTRLKELDLNFCVNLRKLPDSIGNIQNLAELDLCNSGIEYLPNTISGLEKLMELNLWNCKMLTSLPDSIQRMTKLVKLDVRGCGNLILPRSIGDMKNLVELNLQDIWSKELPNTIVSLTNLRKLKLFNCGKLEHLPNQIGCMCGLEKLDLRFCKSLRTIPDSIGSMRNLAELDLSFTGIEYLPESMMSLEKLTTLRMLRCTKPRGLPLGRMKRLQHILVMGSGEEEFRHEEYYEVPEGMMSKHGFCQQSQEDREIELIDYEEDYATWVLRWELSIKLVNQERLIKVEETRMKSWGWQTGMQWLGLIFPREFMCTDQPRCKKPRIQLPR